MIYRIWIVGLMFVSFLPMRCLSCHHNQKTVDGLNLSNCTNVNVHEMPDFPPDIQAIDFSMNPNLEIPRYFLIERSSTLRRLIFHNTAMGSMRRDPPKLDTFSKLSNLEDFEFSDSDLANTEQWILPPKLKKYNVDGNHYTTLDVSPCAELEELSVNRNYLEGLPKLHHAPLPPLRIFRAKNNPLHKLTILDLAPLCYLQELELEFTSYSYLAKPEGFCNCSLFKYFANEMGIKGIEKLNCFTDAPQSYKASCSNDTLNKARQIRKSCPLLTKGPLPSQIKFVLKMIFGSILFLLLLATIILYIIRHFHLREWWRVHHLNQPPPPLRTEEEEEQSLQTGSSISDGSVDDKPTKSK